jgi:hypothetical protein
MRITFKHFATLTDHLPPDARRSNQVELDVAPEASISQIMLAGVSAPYHPGVKKHSPQPSLPPSVSTRTITEIAWLAPRSIAPIW